jgi:hypothetical protein
MILAVLFAVGCGNMTKGKSAAQSQIAVFHQRFNDQDLEAIVAAAHPDLLKESPKSEVINFLSVVRRKLGKVTNSENVNWNVRMRVTADPYAD